MKKTQEQFIDELYEKFPECGTTNTVTRAQIMQMSSYIPAWLAAGKIGRGIYAIPSSGKQTVGVSFVAQSEFTSDSDTDSLIPKKDPNYVPFGQFDDIKLILAAGVFYPVYITGPTGNGKSSMVEQACAALQRPLIRVNLNIMSDEEQLIGSKTLVDGNIEIVEGPILVAMRKGIPILLDECDAGQANTLLCLQPILEGKPYYFKLNNEVVCPAPGFNVFATANTKGKGSEDGKYIGTNVLNEAFLERFAITIEQEYPSAATECRIVSKMLTAHGCSNDTFAQNLTKWADVIRRTYDAGGVDENMTTRRLLHIVKTYAIFRDERKALTLCCNRFDQATKDAFLSLFDKIVPEDQAPAKPKRVKKVAVEPLEVAEDQSALSAPVSSTPPVGSDGSNTRAKLPDISF